MRTSFFLSVLRRLGVAALLLLTPVLVAAAMPPADLAAAPSPRPAATSGSSRHPAAVAGEKAFFAAFNQGVVPKEAPLAPLLGAYASDPADGRTQLLLGANHLWLAATGDHSDPRVIEHLILAEHFLSRARQLRPEDRRIPSWLVPVRLSLAQIEGDGEAKQALLAELYAAYEEDPIFHSFTVALYGFQSPPGSPAFERGLAALRALQEEGACAPEDLTCNNAIRWPHNLEGFVSFFADYELKAGNRQAARRLLDQVRATPSFAEWPYRATVEARLADLESAAARFADDDPDNDPRPVVVSESCSACHMAR